MSIYHAYRQILFMMGVATCVHTPVAHAASQVEPASSPQPSLFRDPDDGAFDISGFLDTATGFFPIVSPITEPAVGYGGFGALVFVDRQDAAEHEGFNRPNMTMVGGFGTENDSRGFTFGDIRFWKEDRLKTMIFGFDSQLSLDFYLPGDSKKSLGYEIKPRGFKAGAEYRLSQNSRWWAGVHYGYSETELKFKLPDQVPPELVPDLPLLNSGTVTPSIRYDSRDSGFTPSKGNYFSFDARIDHEAFGSSRNYEVYSLSLLHFQPLHPQLTLGLYLSGSHGSEDVPFYKQPRILLRGISSTRYQGDTAGMTELELRRQCWNRFSLVGFGGLGAVWDDSLGQSTRDTPFSGGVGWRYELARRYQIHAGMDIGFGPDSEAIYFTVGSAWMRP
ncbi:BamA/TamA family outer membrane protein [Kiritimatiellaeota bacterium B1221]|nr:BamA/TamA family outer membrane protein [Kiritimatiellaeota bacterium B1221]